MFEKSPLFPDGLYILFITTETTHSYILLLISLFSAFRLFFHLGTNKNNKMKHQADKNGNDDLSTSSSFITVPSLPPATTTINNHPEESHELKLARLKEKQQEKMEEFKEEQEKLQYEKDTMDALISSKNNGDDDIVEINVGGKAFLQVLRSTLCLAPSTMFTFMFSGRYWEDSLSDSRRRRTHLFGSRSRTRQSYCELFAHKKDRRRKAAIINHCDFQRRRRLFPRERRKISCRCLIISS